MFMRTRRWLHAGLAAVGLTVAVCMAWPTPEPRASAAPVLPDDVCRSQPGAGQPGRDEISTPEGLVSQVVAPANYDAGRAWGLIVAYPPAGFSAAAAERFYGLTEQATARGWIVAYPNALPLSRRALEVQAGVVAAVSGRWCIHPSRVVLLGHSDGGSVAQGVALRGRVRPAAIVASGAGIRGEDLARETCPPPLSVTVVHSAHDERFPAWGEGTARWWASCLGCARPPPGEGCVSAPGCQAGRLVLCRHDGTHAARPQALRAPWPWIDSAFQPRI